MRKEILIPLTAFVVVACNGDEDGDGFKDDEDCAPADAAINPNADDVFFDGIDQDCDGDDAVPDYVGSWSLASRTITTAGGYEDFEGYTESGSIAVTPTGEATINLDFVLGSDPPDSFNLTSPLTDVEAGAFSLATLTGNFNDYTGTDYATTAAWTCTVDVAMTCTGTLSRGNSDPPNVSDATITFDMD